MLKKYIKSYWMMIFLSVITVSAMTMQYNQTGTFEGKQALLYGFLDSFHGWGLETFFIVIMVATFYYNLSQKYQFNIETLGIAVLFSMFNLIGNAFNISDNLNVIFGNGVLFCNSLIFFVGYTILFFFIIQFLYNFLIEAGQKYIRKGQKNNKNSIMKKAGIIFVLWIPYFFLLYPGTVLYDTGTQLYQYWGYEKLSNKSPYLQTVFIGEFVKMGERLGNANLGVALYVLLQMFCLSVVFSYSIQQMKKMGISDIVKEMVLIIYGVLPIFPVYAVSVGKDINFGITVLLLTIFIFEMFKFPEDFWNNNVKKAIFCVNLVLMCLFRNAAIMLVITCLFILFLKLKDHRKTICYVAFWVLIVLFGWNKLLLPCVIDDHNKYIEENMSIPLQQTARYVKQYKAEIPKEEKVVIDKIVDYDELSNIYNPQISDPVKATFKEDINEHDLKEYLKVYIKQFLKHPICYVEAFLNQCYGYFYPNDKGDIKSVAYFGMNNIEKFNESTGLNLHNVFPTGSKILQEVILRMREIPFLGVLIGIGIYTWILILIILFMIRMKQKELICVTLPAVFIMVGCIASPVNSYFRYALPMIFCIPFLITVCLFGCNESNNP